MTDTKYVHIDWKDMYKDELAQELATERAKVLSEVEEWLVDLQGFCDKSVGIQSGETILYKLRAKLNQLKEEG